MKNKDVGLNLDSKVKELETENTKLKEELDIIKMSFNGYDITKLPSVLISLSAKLFDNHGMFWETCIDYMPDRVQILTFCRRNLVVL